MSDERAGLGAPLAVGQGPWATGSRRPPGCAAETRFDPDGHERRAVRAPGSRRRAVTLERAANRRQPVRYPRGMAKRTLRAARRRMLERAVAIQRAHPRPETFAALVAWLEAALSRSGGRDRGRRGP